MRHSTPVLLLRYRNSSGEDLLTETFDIAKAGLFIWIVLLVSGSVQVLYYWLLFSRFVFAKGKNASGISQPVSVIVCARNESSNLRKNLPALLDQDYPDFELIVVNDCSWDDTGEVLEEFARQYPRLKVVTIVEQERYSHGKKFAVTLGIKAAKNEWLLFTDADCRPASRQWISSMEAGFLQPYEIVLGYGAYEKGGGLLNRLIRFDTALIAMQYFACAISGNAYMGVGRNLAYRKSLFFRNKGFAKHNHLPSGDDDLLVNETATAKNVTVRYTPESFTYSAPRKTLSGWISQKGRHLTTSKYYRTAHRYLLGGFATANLLFFTSAILLLSAGWKAENVGYAYGAVLLLKMPVFAAGASRLREKDVIAFFPLFELLLSFLQPIFFLTQFTTKKHTWK
jgi:cellulose synthase/poly-beta-1,6-N-acetylglucosamine synthase-like glycosyltransferase